MVEHTPIESFGLSIIDVDTERVMDAAVRRATARKRGERVKDIVRLLRDGLLLFCRLFGRPKRVLAVSAELKAKIENPLKFQYGSGGAGTPPSAGAAPLSVIERSFSSQR